MCVRGPPVVLGMNRIDSSPALIPSTIASALALASARRGLRTLVFLQYWRSFDHLESYAQDRNQSHLPAWKEFYRKANRGEAVGIFHETYCVDPGKFETVYGNMPAFGLGKVAGLAPAEGARNKARTRMNATGNVER